MPNYLGCFIDNSTFSYKDLEYQINFGSSNSIDKCISKCNELGFLYAGLQVQYCYCGNTYGLYGKAVNNHECNYICSGNTSQICGNANRNSIYRTVSFSKINLNYF